MGKLEDIHRPKPRLGQVVQILRGRDAGQYAVVVGVVDVKFVNLADGYKRKFNRPKKKNIRHVRLEDYVNAEVASSLHEQGKVTNVKLRYALEQFHLRRLHEEKKGE